MQDSLFELHITEDKLLCYLIYHGKPYDTLHQEQIFYLLNEKKIVFGIQKEKILEILQTIKTSKEFLKIKEIIAKGIPAEESRDGSYKLLISLEPIIPQKSDGSIDYKNIEYYKIVPPKKEILVLYPPYKGKEGINLYGEKIPPREPHPIPIKTGKNIELLQQNDGSILGISKIYGVLQIQDNTIDIFPELIIDDDASIEKGNLKFKNNIRIKKNLLRGLEVFCEKDLYVQGNIESGMLRILGNIFCEGGINTANSGTILCNKTLYANFIENTSIICQENIVVKKSILNSEIVCHGSISILSEKGSLIGGKTIFFESLQCKIFGNNSFLKTEIFVGYHHNNKHILKILLEEFKKIEKELHQLQEELNYYKKLIENRRIFTENQKRMIQLKIQQFQKIKEIFIKKKNTIQYLKNHSYQNKPIQLTPEIIYPGVCFYYFEKKFPINETLQHRSLLFEPSTHDLKIL